MHEQISLNPVNYEPLKGTIIITVIKEFIKFTEINLI